MAEGVNKVILLGNLGQAKLLWEGWKALGATAVSDATPSALVAVARGVTGIWRWLFEGQQLAFRPEWWYWNASRIMAHGEINEFPFFTFLYGDLHAHMTALPYALLALGIMVSVVRRRSARITPAPRLTAHWLCWIRRL